MPPENGERLDLFGALPTSTSASTCNCRAHLRTHTGTHLITTHTSAHITTHTSIHATTIDAIPKADSQPAGPLSSFPSPAAAPSPAVPPSLQNHRSSGYVLPAGLPSSHRLGPPVTNGRFSPDVGPGLMMSANWRDWESTIRSPISNVHNHGFGLSGLRRIRQHPPISAFPAGLPRSASASAMRTLQAPFSHHCTPFSHHPPYQPQPLRSDLMSSSSSFSEDLTRFPSESLHSFSFAQPSEDIAHNRHAWLLELFKDRVGWPGPSSSASSPFEPCHSLASQQPIIPRTTSPELIFSPNSWSSTPSRLEPFSSFTPRKSDRFDRSPSPTSASPCPALRSQSSNPTLLDETSATFIALPPSISRSVSREQTTPAPVPVPVSASTHATYNGPTFDSKDDTSDRCVVPVMDVQPSTILQSGVMGQLARFRNDSSGVPLSSSASRLSTTSSHFPVDIRTSHAPPPTALHGHVNRWVPAAQAIFTTEARPPWTVLAANDLACLVFGVTKAEVHRMGILEVVQEDRRHWLERKLLRVDNEPPTASPSAPVYPDPPKPCLPNEGSEAAVPQQHVLEPTSSPKLAVATSIATSTSAHLKRRNGITAHLLSKPSSRAQGPSPFSPTSSHAHPVSPPPQSLDQGQTTGRETLPPQERHPGTWVSSKPVLLCGDVIPTRKRNGATGSASVWVKEKKVGLIWVLEEIHEDMAIVSLEEEGSVSRVLGAAMPIWGVEPSEATAPPSGHDISTLIPRIPRQGIIPRTGEIDFAQMARRKFFTCPNAQLGVNIPCKVERVNGGSLQLRVSSLPHMAGILVLDPSNMRIKSSNAAFCGALFGFEKADGMPITALVPAFDQLLNLLSDDFGVLVAEGTVVPEHLFRRAAASLNDRAIAASATATAPASPHFRADGGVLALHRDGSVLWVDVQMCIVKSEHQIDPDVASASPSASVDHTTAAVANDDGEMVYALWITYSRHLHARKNETTVPPGFNVETPSISAPSSPMHQPSPGQAVVRNPPEFALEVEKHMQQTVLGKQSQQWQGDSTLSSSKPPQRLSLLDSGKVSTDPGASHSHPTATATDGSIVTTTASSASSPGPGPAAILGAASDDDRLVAPSESLSTVGDRKKTITDFDILEDMGQGAYGHVKLARNRATGRKVVLKYVTKRRILVDTWTRDRRLGTVPLEIHVLDYLRSPALRHPNIVEMDAFFEDQINYYIEMVPHGLPGMDLFDHIELRSDMDEAACHAIIVQVARAVYHLHVHALVVHRDIKDENVILDAEGNIKLIDFGSAAYIRSGPFDVFVGTIDYAAPEVLAGKAYGGKEQDVWALGILLYTVIFKTNPFYSVDEIMDHDLRVPFDVSPGCIDLVRHMLDRDVSRRFDIEQVLAHPWCRDPTSQLSQS